MEWSGEERIVGGGGVEGRLFRGLRLDERACQNL